MAAVLRKAFDPVAVRREQAAYEAALLATVGNYRVTPVEARKASIELLNLCSSCNVWDENTRTAYELGKERVAAKASFAGLHAGRCWISTIDFFIVKGKKRSGGKSSQDNRLELRRANGDWLSKAELRAALSSADGKTQSTKRTGDVEQWLTDHLRSLYPSYTRSECAKFVRDSFPELDWNDWRATFPYT